MKKSKSFVYEECDLTICNFGFGSAFPQENQMGIGYQVLKILNFS